MSTRPKLICFDWDGTLINAFDTITNAILISASTLGYKRIHPKHIEGKIGIPFEQLVTSLYGNIDVQKFESIYKQVYQDLPVPKLLPGAYELINQLKAAFLLAIVTNKQRHILERELKHHKLDRCFDSVWVAEDYAPKPSPLMLRHAVGTHHATAEETWMVGDSLADFYAAQSAHISKTILLNPQHRPNWVDNLECIENLNELYNLLNLVVYQ